MSGLKTYLSAWVFAGALASQGHAGQLDLAETMAGCAGRFSAELEHAWLMRDSQSAALERQRDRFIELLEAVAPEATAPDTLSHRITAKHAQATLLTQAAFGTDAVRAIWARKQSRYYKDRCARLLLES